MACLDIDDEHVWQPMPDNLLLTLPGATEYGRSCARCGTLGVVDTFGDVATVETDAWDPVVYVSNDAECSGFASGAANLFGLLLLMCANAEPSPAVESTTGV